MVMTRHTAIKMVKRRALEAELPDEISNHSFSGTGITEYLRNGGDLNRRTHRRPRIDAHHAAYNRVHEELSLDEMERINI